MTDDLTFDLSDELYEALRLQAEANGRTPDEEARAILIGVLESHIHLDEPSSFTDDGQTT